MFYGGAFNPTYGLRLRQGRLNRLRMCKNPPGPPAPTGRDASTSGGSQSGSLLKFVGRDSHLDIRGVEFRRSRESSMNRDLET